METIKLDLIPGKKMPSLHASQYDDGREHGIDLFENGVVYKLDGTETLTINERKGDDCICSLDIENTFADSNHIVFASTEQMCAVWGNNICELVIAKGEKTIGTLNFILEIEQSPTEGGIESESEIKNLKRQIEAITEEVIGDDYYTKTQTDNAIATAIEGKADTTYVDTELAKKADKTDTYTKTQTDNLLNAKANASSVYTKAEVDTKLSAKANTGDVYTKSQTDNLLNDKANVTDLPDMTQYYDKSEVDDLLDDKADADNTYTKTEVDDIVYNILPDDTASGSVANFTTSLELPIKSLEVDVNAVQTSGIPSPSSPLLISGWNETRVFHSGKNLLDKSEYPNLRTNYDYVSNSYYCKEIQLQPNTVYTLSQSAGTTSTAIILMNNVPQVNDRNYFDLRKASDIKTYTTDDTGKLYIGIVSTNTDSQYNERLEQCKVQIEVGSVSTDYEPYNGNTEVIELGGTYYGGHFTQDKAGHRQFEVTHIAFDDWANKNVKLYGINTHGIANFYLDHFSQLTKANVGICNLLTKQTSLYSETTEEGFLVNPSTQYIRVLSTRASTIEEFKTWADNNDLMIINELATPIIIDLPDGEPIITLNGTNNIYADTGDCAVEYKCSVAEYVANHSGGGGAKSLGGVFLGGSNSGSEEEPTEDTEDTEKTKEIDEPKEEIKTIGDVKKLGGE